MEAELLGGPNSDGAAGGPGRVGAFGLSGFSDVPPGICPFDPPPGNSDAEEPGGGKEGTAVGAVAPEPIRGNSGTGNEPGAMGAGPPAGGSAGGGGNVDPEAEGSTGMDVPEAGVEPPSEGGSAPLPAKAAVVGLAIPGVRLVTGATGRAAGPVLIGGADASALAIRRSGKGRAGAAGRLLTGTFVMAGGITPGTAGTTDGSSGVRGTGPPAGSTGGADRSWSDGSIGMLADA
jgi:collagen type II alpha